MTITTRVQRQSCWISGATGERTFSWLHRPTGATRKKTGVIIVGPIGPEYMHSHRSLRYLADQMAMQGFLSLRYDPLGMGNSSHDLGDATIVQGWLDTLTAARNFFLTTLNISDIVIISLRSGALLANEYLAQHPVSGAVFWYPYLKGSAFVRDLQIIDSMLHMNSAEAGFIEAGGYPLYPAAQARLEDIDLLGSTPLALARALVINNAAQPPTKKLQQKLAASGIDTTQQNLTGLERMMKQSEITLVPEDNIAVIVDWLKVTFADEEENVSAHQEIASSWLAEGFRETALTIAVERPMFGVLTEPLKRDTQKPLLVFVNGGSGHHVGPNRLYVDICRRLVEDGFSSVRLDLSNLGDSAQEITQESHNPYALTASADILAALNYLKETTGYTHFVFAGLCSGAHNSFQAALALRSPEIKEIILINPLAFHWKQGDSLLAPEDSQHEADAVHYGSNVRSLRKWVSLFINPHKLRNAFAFAFRLGRKKLAGLTKRVAGTLGFVQHSPLERDLLLINSAGTKITLFIGETEPGYRLLIAQAGETVRQQVEKGQMNVAIIKGGDHTFSSSASRQHLVNLFVQQFHHHVRH